MGEAPFRLAGVDYVSHGRKWILETERPSLADLQGESTPSIDSFTALRSSYFSQPLGERLQSEMNVIRRREAVYRTVRFTLQAGCSDVH